MALVADSSQARTADDLAPTAPRVRRWDARPWLAFVAGLAILATLSVALASRWSSTTAPSTVVASGRIEGRSVTLAPKTIQARVKALLVDEGDIVTKGQRVAELEAAQLEARHAGLSAQLAALDAQIQEARLDVEYTAKTCAASIAAADAELSTARARVTRAEAVVANARAEHERAGQLYTAGAISQEELDARGTGWRVSAAELIAAEKDAARASAGLVLAHASSDTVALKRQRVVTLLETRRAVEGQADEVAANLAERFLVAPIDATILVRAVEVGDVVNAGTPVFEIVDMNRLYLKVYVPEPDIGKLRLGDAADISVDAFPGRRFPARISRIHQQAEFTPKNVETAEERMKLVFGVELAVDDTGGVLKPGMPADCIIHWDPAATTTHGVR